MDGSREMETKYTGVRDEERLDVEIRGRLHQENVKINMKGICSAYLGSFSWIMVTVIRGR